MKSHESLITTREGNPRARVFLGVIATTALVTATWPTAITPFKEAWEGGTQVVKKVSSSVHDAFTTECEPSGTITVERGEADWDAAGRTHPKQDPRKTLWQWEQVNPHFTPGENHSGVTINDAECS